MSRSEMPIDPSAIIQRYTVGADAASLEIPPTSYRNIHFLLVQVRDDIPEAIETSINLVISACRDGVILSFMSSILLIAFGTHESDDQENRKKSQKECDRIFAALGKDVRSISFSAEVLCGIHGTNERTNYGTLVPNFEQHLRSLLDAPFGQATFYDGK